MAFERKWREISPISFASDGQADGQVVLATTKGFRAKQKIRIKSNTQPTLNLEVKRVLSSSLMLVGPVSASMDDLTDLSAYLTVDSTTIEAPEQNRPSIPATEHERAVYEEEPVVAKRSVLVDEYGNKINEKHPLNIAGQQLAIMNNLQNLQVAGNTINSSQFLLNNDGFFIFDNSGNFIKAG